MTPRARRWIWVAAVGVVALLVAAIACLGFWTMNSGNMVHTAYEVKLPRDYVYVGNEITLVHAEKAFFASAYGGWHGDGSEMTAYKVRSADVPLLLAALRRKYPNFSWEERFVPHSDVGYLAKQMPPEFRPAETTRLLHGVAADGARRLEYYFDRQLEVLFAVSIQS
jgi:hypothetical protein